MSSSYGRVEVQRVYMESVSVFILIFIVSNKCLHFFHELNGIVEVCICMSFYGIMEVFLYFILWHMGRDLHYVVEVPGVSILFFME